MKIVSLSYVRSSGFHDPQSWLERIRPYGEVLEALAKKHSVISIEQIDYEGGYQWNGVEYHFVRIKNRRWPTALHRLVKELKPDVVIIHGLGFSLQVIQLRRALGKDVIILAQNHADRIPTGWRKWLRKIADRSINAYLFTSTEMALPWIRNKIIPGESKIKEVMVGASIFPVMNKVAAKSITKMKGSPAFLYVGRVDANKDPRTLIEAFSNFARLQPAASLYLIIQNPEKKHELQKLIEENDLMHVVFIIGKIPHPEMQSWFNSADFIISTSYAEAFGMAVSEAMSCGCIPIVTNIPSFRKLTDNGNLGILFEPGNAGQLASALEKAAKLNLDDERKKILSHYNTYLSAEAIAEQICKAANSL